MIDTQKEKENTTKGVQSANKSKKKRDQKYIDQRGSFQMKKFN